MTRASGLDPLAGLRESLEPWLRQIIREELGAPKESLPRLLYSTKEAAEIIGVPPTWLASAARKGLVPCVRCGHYVQFSMVDLQEFIDKNKKNC